MTPRLLRALTSRVPNLTTPSVAWVCIGRVYFRPYRSGTSWHYKVGIHGGAGSSGRFGCYEGEFYSIPPNEIRADIRPGKDKIRVLTALLRSCR